MSITINASIAAAYKDVVDDKTPTNWLLVGYNSANPRELVEVGRGTGGYDEFISKLADDIVFGVFRWYEHRRAPPVLLSETALVRLASAWIIAGQSRVAAPSSCSCRTCRGRRRRCSAPRRAGTAPN